MRILLLQFLILVTACNLKGGSNTLTTSDSTSNDNQNESNTTSFDLNEVDLVLLHVSGSGLLGGDLSDDGNVLVFSDTSYSGTRSFRKDLSSSTLTFDDIGMSESLGGSGNFSPNTGFVSMSGYDSSNFRIDGDGDYSYFSAYKYNGDNNTTILFRKSQSSDYSEEILRWSGGNLAKGSVSKSGEFVVFSSNSVEHLPYNPFNNDQDFATGITNLFKFNTLSNEIFPITQRMREADDHGLQDKFVARNGSISNDGDHVIFTVADIDQNMYSQPPFGFSGVRSALIYRKLGLDDKTIVINDTNRFPSRYTGPLDQRISSDGLHAVFSVAASGYSGPIEIWHFDSTVGISGQMKIISTNESGTKVHASLVETKVMNICDISPDGEYVAIISNNMNFIGKDIESGPHLFLKNVRTGKVDLISSKIDGSELPGRVLNCYFTEKGSSLLFTHEEELFLRRLFKKKIAPSP